MSFNKLLLLMILPLSQLPYIMSQVLQSGTYVVRNGDFEVGRNLREDRTLLPKPVVLGPDVQGTTLEIEQIGSEGNNYLIKARGAPTANINNLVSALLTNEETAEEWRIEAVPQHGENRYIITTQDQEEGWVAPDEPGAQINCKPLISTKSFPPMYLPTEVFEIVSA
ncbi:hypothetical protein D9758_005808 [Tetrapyrgos nigripes]|uniref:Uncharacterized protein n=1 Tax=Tetrapyrgos nigripes TaxID=182062 RepID=A0A8H5LR05_9AGAR|nr:hypothetical protein D9758_005808 [Tetrapyrgos nigripes]